MNAIEQAEVKPEDIVLILGAGPIGIAVCKLSSTYEDMFSLVKDYFSDFTKAEREKFLGGNATRFYGL